MAKDPLCVILVVMSDLRIRCLGRGSAGRAGGERIKLMKESDAHRSAFSMIMGMMQSRLVHLFGGYPAGSQLGYVLGASVKPCGGKSNG